MRWSVLAMGLMLFTAGCIGGLGEDENGSDGNGSADNGSDDDITFGGNASVNDSNDSNDTNASFEGNASFGNDSDNGSGNETGNETGDPTVHEENRTGTASSTNLVITSSGGATESFTVENGTLALGLNMSADGGELDVVVTPPGCEDESCQRSTTTEDGNASITVDAPDEGEWTVDLTPTGIGPHSVDYELIIRLELGPTAEA